MRLVSGLSMLSYKERDEARRLYQKEGWSLKELEVKFGQKMTDYVIPQYLRTAREERIRARKQRVINNRRMIAAEKKRREKYFRLNKADAVQMNNMSERIRQFDLKSVKINIKQCNINKFLMGKL